MIKFLMVIRGNIANLANGLSATGYRHVIACNKDMKLDLPHFQSNPAKIAKIINQE